MVIFRDGKYLTLREVFESLKLTGEGEGAGWCELGQGMKRLGCISPAACVLNHSTHALALPRHHESTTVT